MICESLLKQIDFGRTGKNHGFSMGLEKLESIIDGVMQSTYTLLFSGTGSGKSTLALYSYVYVPLKEHLEDGNYKVTYYSLEMSAEMLFAKLLSLHMFDTYGVDISTKELLSRKKDYILSDELYEIINESMEWLNKVEKVVTVYDKGLNADILYANLSEELSKCGKTTETEHRKIYTPNNPNLIHTVIIDHMSLVRPKPGRSLKEEMDLISSYLITFRNRCGISPLVIMQANRDSAGMERRKQGLNNLRLSDTKDSGNMAQDAEIVISIFNPHREHLSSYNKYDIRILEDHFRSITVLKEKFAKKIFGILF